MMMVMMMMTVMIIIIIVKMEKKSPGRIGVGESRKSFDMNTSFNRN